MAPRVRSRGKKKETAPKPVPPKPLSLRQLTRALPTMAEFDQIDRETVTAHDRAVAILLATQVQRYVEIVTISHLSRRDEATIETLVDRDGPLGTFSSTIRLAYALGLITTNEKNDLNKIRDIRNAFAHAMVPISFKTPQLATLIEGLYAISGYRSGAEEDVSSATPLALALAGYIVDNDERLKFSYACRALSSRILKAGRRD